MSEREQAKQIIYDLPGYKIKKVQLGEWLSELYQVIKDKGQLVKVMEKTDNYLLSPFKCYKKHLGVVPIRDKYGNISHVYVAYEDFDGSIKYYDYPQ